MESGQMEKLRARLEEEKTTIEKQLAEHGVGPDAEGLTVDDAHEGFSDSAHVTAERSQLITLVDGLRSHHADIVTSLERMDEGTYGKCESCGKDIPFERLEALPAARLCVDCKTR